MAKGLLVIAGWLSFGVSVYTVGTWVEIIAGLFSIIASIMYIWSWARNHFK